MLNKISLILLFFVLLIVSSAAAAQDETLTNENVLQLTRATFSKTLIIQKIRASKTNFETTVQKLIDLKDGGVDEEVIAEMLKSSASTAKHAPSAEKPAVVTPPVDDKSGKTPPPDSGGKKVEPDTATKPPRALEIDSKVNNYKTASPVMAAKAKKIAELFVSDRDAGENENSAVSTAVGLYTELFGYSIARSIEADSDKESAIVNLQPLEFMPEMNRTDKQIGSSASTMASTSAIDKPGFANLLGLAIENGFIEQNVRDTVLTLSTSPSAFFSIGEKDQAKAYQNAGFLNKIGLSASFNINNKNPLLNNVSESQLKEFSVRYRFWGDHSARSPALRKIWETDVAPGVVDLLAAIGQSLEFVDNTPSLRNLRNSNVAQFAESLKAKWESTEFKALAADKREAELTNFILNFLKATVADQFKDAKVVLTDEEKKGIRDKMSTLLQVQKKQTFDLIKKKLDNFFKSPIGTVAYVSNRDPMGNYSQLKLLLSFSNTMFKPLSLTLNAGMSFYHNPNVVMKQERIRDFDFALSFEGKRTVSYLQEGDFTPITYSFTGRYQRLMENQQIAGRKADLVKAQFLLTFPLFRGVSMPFSATYSNATEMEKKQGFRINFGLKFDADKFFDLNRLKKLVP